ncbi:MAG: GHMP kinase [Alphaproteobacteria bacterium]
MKIRTNETLPEGGCDPRLVMTATPQRISFAGGGTDLADYYGTGFGAVLSTTIDKFVYVTVKQHGAGFQEQYRLNYAETENVNSLDEIRNDIARECLRLVPVPPPLYISTVGDLPAASGLGGSSSFAVGLLKALHAMRGERISPAQVAEEAVHVEVDVLKRPIGKQDHVAAAFGGFNYFRFNADGTLNLVPHSGAIAGLNHLFDHFQLFWTGISRDSASVLTEQKHNTRNRMEELDAMRDQAEALSLMLRGRLDVKAFGQTLDEGWQLKRRLASSVSNDRINHWYQVATAAGAIGGKLCGAGGGGFLLFVTPENRRAAVRAALSELQQIPIAFEPSGSRLILPYLD